MLGSGFLHDVPELISGSVRWNRSLATDAKTGTITMTSREIETKLKEIEEDLCPIASTSPVLLALHAHVLSAWAIAKAVADAMPKQ